MNSIRKINQLNQQELKTNVSDRSSWHYDYRDTSYIFVGNLAKDLSEKDILVIFSQYGIPTHLNVIKDRVTGSPRGFCYLKYENFRSAILAIDNLNGIKLFDKNIKVDHVYYTLKDDQKEDDFAVDYTFALRDNNHASINQKVEKKLISLDDAHSYKGNNDKSGIPLHENKKATDSDADNSDEFKDPMADFLVKKESLDKRKRKHRSHHKHRHSHKKNRLLHEETDKNYKVEKL